MFVFTYLKFYEKSSQRGYGTKLMVSLEVNLANCHCMTQEWRAVLY